MNSGTHNNLANNSAKSKEQKLIVEAKKNRDKQDRKGYYTVVPGHQPKTEVFVKKGERKEAVIRRFKDRYGR